MKLAIVVGSHRTGSQSMKVAQFVAATVRKEIAAVEVYLLDLAKNPLPLWDEDFDQGSERWKSLWGPIAQQLGSCDGLVIVTPEWSGMAPAALKNFFLLAGNAEIAHKPALIVGVSHSQGGAYPISELRAHSYKNNHVCYIPEHVIVRDVLNVLNDLERPSSEQDKYIRDRTAYAVRLLGAYARALIGVRNSGMIDHQTFPYGM